MIKLFASRTFWRGILVFNAFSVLLPVLFMVNSALRKDQDFAANPMKLARDPYWENFSKVWQGGAFATYFKNSMLITGGSLLVILILSVGAGFVIGRYDFKGHTAVLGFILTGMLIPAKLTIIPLFIQLKWMHLLDSHLGLILVYSSGALPAAILGTWALGAPWTVVPSLEAWISCGLTGRDS